MDDKEIAPPFAQWLRPNESVADALDFLPEQLILCTDDYTESLLRLRDAMGWKNSDILSVPAEHATWAERKKNTAYNSSRILNQLPLLKQTIEGHLNLTGEATWYRNAVARYEAMPRHSPEEVMALMELQSYAVSKCLGNLQLLNKDIATRYPALRKGEAEHGADRYFLPHDKIHPVSTRQICMSDEAALTEADES
jgi:hypothetical protein